MSNDEKTGGKQGQRGTTGKKSGAKSGKAYTAPKGRPTVHPTPGARSRRFSSTTEWLIALVVFVAVLLAIFYLGRDFRSQTGAPLEHPGGTVAVVAEASRRGVAV